LEVSDRHAKEQPTEKGEEWGTEVTVQPRHRARLDTAFKAVPHDEIGTGTQLVKKWPELIERIGVVRVSHHDITASGRGYALPQGSAVPADRHLDNARAFAKRNIPGRIARAVVRNNDLSREPKCCE
jgi:hypothetical protein